MKTLALSLVLLSVAACGSGHEPLTPETAKLLIADAVTIPRDLLDEITSAGQSFHPATASDFPFSLLLLTAPVVPESDDLRTIRDPEAPPPTPKEIWIDAGSGRLTLLTGEHILSVTVEEEDDGEDGNEGSATGSFRWRRPNFVEGRGTFGARRAEDGWEIVELGLPAVKASVALRKDGTWGMVEGL